VKDETNKTWVLDLKTYIIDLKRTFLTKNVQFWPQNVRLQVILCFAKYHFDAIYFVCLKNTENSVFRISFRLSQGLKFLSIENKVIVFANLGQDSHNFKRQLRKIFFCNFRHLNSWNFWDQNKFLKQISFKSDVNYLQWNHKLPAFYEILLLFHKSISKYWKYY